MLSFEAKFNEFLNSIKTSKDDFTHLNIQGGKYKIDNVNILQQLYNFINEGIQLNKNMYICERNDKNEKCIIVDFDFKYNNYSNENKRKYTIDNVKNLFKIYIKKILEYHSVEIDHRIAYIFEKKNPYVNDKNEIKDGIHMVFPFIISNNIYQETIRLDLINDNNIYNEIEFMNCNNNIDDILDKAILRNPWLLYGCKKDDTKDPYLFSYILEYDEENDNVYKIDKNFSNIELILFNSVRSKRIKENLLTNGITQTIKKIDKKVKNKVVSYNMDLNTTINNKDKKFILIKEFVNILDIKRVTSYEDWIKLGWCLRNICNNEDYLKLWIIKSKSVEKYELTAESDCCDEWYKDNNNDNKLTEGSLRMWCKQDNFQKYNELIKKDVRKKINFAVNNWDTHVPMAKIIYEYYKNEYYSVNEKWYKFNDKFHKWEAMDKNIDFSNKLSEEFFNLIYNFQIELKKQKDAEILNANNIDEDDDESVEDKKMEIIKKYEKKENNIQKLLKQLLKGPFKKNVIEECANLFIYINDIDNKVFEEILDTNNDLIVFTNGVYNLKYHTFRKGEPEDFLSVTTNISYKEFSYEDKTVKEVYAFLKQILPINNVFEYVMKVLASCLSGDNKDENVYFFTGEGGNGKSKLIELMKLTLGDLYISPPASILQQKRSSAEGASPHLVSTKSRRMVVLQEPEDTKLNAGILKEWTGGDSITGRGLYEKHPICFKPQFKLFITANNLPQLPPDDGGVWRRVKNIKYISTFKDNPSPDPKKNEYKIDKLLSNKMKNWNQAFMWILIQHYKKYISEGLIEPKEVIEEINNYKREYDTLSQWLEECIDITGDKTHYIKQNQAYQSYKDYCSNNCQLGYKNLKDFMKFMEKKHNKMSNDKKWTGIKLKNENY